MAASVAFSPACRRLPCNPLSASTGALSLVRLAGCSRRLRRACATAEPSDVLPGSGAGELDGLVPAGLLEELPEGLAFQGAPDGSGGHPMLDRGINAAIVLGAITFALTKLLTVDHDYWHGWTILEILRYMPQHNWSAYEEALKANPVLVKMMISGIVYSLGDWIAQCYEGKPIFEFDRARMFRSGLIGFALQGSLSHYYYNFCESVFPCKDWWAVPVKAAFDQTAWSGLWNTIYFVALGFLRWESPSTIFSELKSTFFPMLTAGWKLWPFAHLITYGVVPVEHRLLWVDCVEIIWVTILSTYSNEKSEARILDDSSTTDTRDNSR
ncbi:hypothetical protein CFC21_026709 [Triticum aestivum]|uniref:Peroxisomal membrane protein n=2 Tax=Triticum aestivum TaxID=4565 RepID=A0A9R1EMN0_WHEAT|nr:protein SYM1-like [Triticum dicoccoides]XP_044321169.1 protein SYM1-like [Triticum aestivum]KAF7012527.1 hypothetical protein CFC21_026709 [Triticum aestivum]